MEKVIVLDFGGQYALLIARRVREAHVYCEVLPCTAPLSAMEGASAIIFTGGPSSVYEDGAPDCDHGVYDLRVPILGICYGAQLIARTLGGNVAHGESGEYGRVDAQFYSHPLFTGVEHPTVWMSHRDRVEQLPEGFAVLASSEHCPIAAYGDDLRRIYGLQFHPEVRHTVDGQLILENFFKLVCRFDCDWHAESLIDSSIREIRAQVGDGRVISGISGGVDSSVASTLVNRAIGKQLTCIFVDHGLLRKNEAAEVLSAYRDRMGLEIVYVDAAERFLTRLQGVTDPERKRKIIGEEFIRVFEEEAQKLGGADFLVQGTIYPDIVESGGSSVKGVKGKSAVIKSHHNVGGLPKDTKFRGIIEPLRNLFKDEVRALGEALGIPSDMVWRQPFPGPGLAVRILGAIDADNLRIVRETDAILREEIARAGLSREIWQYFTVYTPLKSVGVMGDSRTYDNVVAVRAVSSSDAMTVDFSDIPHDVLGTISNRIINEVPGVNRVVYDITSKPPGTIEWE
ncbi:MAG: glutamine-hydrolyzing GMP synthase [Clostridiaceae bacterium]|nr:glutamine-hydrolyzing GMP synthase [Clostridiaceae bacterium]